MKVHVILLAGGIGSRMKTEVPKQFLTIHGKPLLHYSMEMLLGLKNLGTFVVVLPAEWSSLLKEGMVRAEPGLSRQDSVASGLKQLEGEEGLVVIHDGARPMATLTLLKKVVDAAMNFGAAAPALPCSQTIKQKTSSDFVKKTLPREGLYEIQTPQALRLDLMRTGMEKVQREKLSVTDDVSIAELLGHPVKLVEGDSSNLKITHPIDLIIAEHCLNVEVMQ